MLLAIILPPPPYSPCENPVIQFKKFVQEFVHRIFVANRNENNRNYEFNENIIEIIKLSNKATKAHACKQLVSNNYRAQLWRSGIHIADIKVVGTEIKWKTETYRNKRKKEREVCFICIAMPLELLKRQTFSEALRQNWRR